MFIVLKDLRLCAASRAAFADLVERCRLEYGDKSIFCFTGEIYLYMNSIDIADVVFFDELIGPAARVYSVVSRYYCEGRPGQEESGIYDENWQWVADLPQTRLVLLASDNNLIDPPVVSWRPAVVELRQSRCDETLYSIVRQKYGRLDTIINADDQRTFGWTPMRMRWENVLCYEGRHELAFTTGIASVTGPNMSGKSSLIDIYIYGLFGLTMRRDIKWVNRRQRSPAWISIDVLVGGVEHVITTDLINASLALDGKEIESYLPITELLQVGNIEDCYGSFMLQHNPFPLAKILKRTIDVDAVNSLLAAGFSVKIGGRGRRLTVFKDGVKYGLDQSSVGQRFLIELAIRLVAFPHQPIIFIDEGMSVLDDHNMQHVAGVLRDTGASVLVIGHKRELGTLADRVIDITGLSEKN